MKNEYSKTEQTSDNHEQGNSSIGAVGSSDLSDWNEKVIKAKRDFAIAFTKWVNSPDYKKMIEEMKRLGAIR